MLRKYSNFIIVLNSVLLFTQITLSNESAPFQGRSTLSLLNHLEVSVITSKDFDLIDQEGTRRYWKTTIRLKNRGKVVWEKTHKEFKQLEWVYAHIVPIRKNEYFTDLNGDGLNEIAILPWDFGMAIYRNVEIYTVTQNELINYGDGKYHFEQGPNVLLGCSKCSKFNFAACNQCY